MSHNSGSVKGFAATRGRPPFEHSSSIGAAIAQIASIVLLAGALALTGCGGGGGAGTTLTVTSATLVSITVSGTVPSIATGQTESFTATGVYTDQSTQNLTTQVSWSSSSNTIATVNTSGVATAVAPGTTTLTATLSGVSGSTPLSVSFATLGISWPMATYEAESGTLTGAAAIVGAPDGSDRTVGDSGGEASQRQAVVLTNTGDAVSWSVKSTEAGANALVVRFSIPDAPGGGGAGGSLALTVVAATGKTIVKQPLQLTSRYSWLYGGVLDGTKLFDVPANAMKYAIASDPTHLFDEIQLKLNVALQPGDTLTLAKTATSGPGSFAVDFVDLETVPAPIPEPTGFVSLADPRCGGMPLDLRQTGSAFDGADDSSYGSVFNAVLGNNPFNPVSFAVVEKDYYSTNPATDVLQDGTPTPSSGGQSMWQLADHNFQSLQACIGLVTAASSGLTGVYIPPGRFYMRGLLLLPSNVTLQGAGMWYSKLAAVDTAPPTAVTNAQGLAGIASVSGNLVISSQAGGANNVILSNLAIFGNVTQRDVVDAVIPDGVRAQLTNSIIDNVWVEHTFSGLKLNQNSNTDRIANSRVRNTFADGIDFYGSTSNSLITNSSARSTGDDGFAMWSQGSTLATTSQSNGITGSKASLQWYGNGFAIYGGTNMSIVSSAAADILNYPCLQASTYFVSAALPASVTMSASASKLNFYRCGGNGYNQQYGAVALVTDTESISALSLDQINIANPSYETFDIRSVPLPASRTVVATVNATIQNAAILNAPACAVAGAYTGGSAQLNNVCSCASTASAPTACTTNIAPTSILQITPNTCSATMCPAF
jgi:hypothetical protein